MPQVVLPVSPENVTVGHNHLTLSVLQPLGDATIVYFTCHLSHLIARVFEELRPGVWHLLSESLANDQLLWLYVCEIMDAGLLLLAHIPVEFEYSQAGVRLLDFMRLASAFIPIILEQALAHAVFQDAVSQSPTLEGLGRNTAHTSHLRHAIRALSRARLHHATDLHHRTLHQARILQVDGLFVELAE